MNAISADPKGVPMKVMLEGLEKKTGFTNADELSHHDERIQFMNNQDVQIQVLSYGNGSPSNLVGQKPLNYVKSQRSIGKLYCTISQSFCRLCNFTYQ